MNQTTRRGFLAQTAGAAASLAAANRKPNIIYVFADQLRYQSCGYAGDSLAQTPNIDRLAGSSLSLRNAISSTPVCAPHRASLMTGKYTSSTGMAINELRLSPEHEFFGQVLSKGGYQTAYIGKWHLWANALGGHQKTVNAFVPPGPYRFGFDNFWSAYNFNHTYYNSPYFRDLPERKIHTKYEPDSQTDQAIQFIREAKGKPEPFALFLSWGPPHDPWAANNVPEEFKEAFRDKKIPLRANYSDTPDPYADSWATPDAKYPSQVDDFQKAYYTQTANIDWNVGRLVKAIDEAGLAGDTILVFTSDHGEMFGSHGRRAKLIFYEEAVRVPFLVRWPGHLAAGKISDVCLGTPDIMPTILGMVGLPIPKAVEGSDLSRRLLGKGGSEPEMAYLQGLGTTAAWKDGSEWRALRDHRFTYATYRKDGKQLLFDNSSDPYQMKNLADDRRHAAKVKHYGDKLKTWRKERNDTFEACTWYRDHWTQDRNIVNTATGVKQKLEPLQELIKRYYPNGTNA